MLIHYSNAQGNLWIPPPCSEVLNITYDGFMFNPQYEAGSYFCGNEMPLPTGVDFAGTRYYSSSPILVYGIAATMVLPPASLSGTEYINPYTDSLWGKLLIKDGNRYVTVDSARIRNYFRRNQQLFKPPRYFHYDYGHSTLTGHTGEYSPLYEFYFEQPVLVHDTFFVGPWIDYNHDHMEMNYLWSSCTGCAEGEILFLSDTGRIPLGPYFSNVWGGCFPILMPYEEVEGVVAVDTVPNFHLKGMRIGYPTFAWDTNICREEDLFEVQFAPYRSEEWRTVSTTDSSIEVYSVFDPDIYYQARVRARRHHLCPIHDTVMWGPWCRPILFYTGPTEPDTTNSIASVASESAFFTLTPNPTDGKVVVEVKSDKSGEATITVSDATGREVLKQKASTLNSQLSTLNLEALPAGTYFVTVTIDGQSGTRKLVVK